LEQKQREKIRKKERKRKRRERRRGRKKRVNSEGREVEQGKNIEIRCRERSQRF
jgi:hypothetical protein